MMPPWAPGLWACSPSLVPTVASWALPGGPACGAGASELLHPATKTETAATTLRVSKLNLFMSDLLILQTPRTTPPAGCGGSGLPETAPGPHEGSRPAPIDETC